MNQYQLFLEKIGCKVQYAGDGKIFTKWNNKNVMHKKYKYIVTINNERFITKELEFFIPLLIKHNKIQKSDVTSHGHKICGRCGGKGIVQHFSHVEGGFCFRCNGEGIFWKFN